MPVVSTGLCTVCGPCVDKAQIAVKHLNDTTIQQRFTISQRAPDWHVCPYTACISE